MDRLKNLLLNQDHQLAFQNHAHTCLWYFNRSKKDTWSEGCSSQSSDADDCDTLGVWWLIQVVAILIILYKFFLFLFFFVNRGIEIIHSNVSISLLYVNFSHKKINFTNETMIGVERIHQEWNRKWNLELPSSGGTRVKNVYS